MSISNSIIGYISVKLYVEICTEFYQVILRWFQVFHFSLLMSKIHLN